jgi:hypothetical protein
MLVLFTSPFLRRCDISSLSHFSSAGKRLFTTKFDLNLGQELVDSCISSTGFMVLEKDGED